MNPTNITLAVSIFLAWKASVYLYRLYFSPLAGFPGPRLAAATWLYEFYYDVLKPGGGLYIWKIQELHERYGPIVRINPCELHIADPEFYDTIYAGANSPRDKWRLHQKAAQAEGAIGHTVDHKLHRTRKEAMSGFFSKRSVRERERIIQSKADLLCTRLVDYQRDGRPANLTVAYLAFCMDIITDYAFGKAYGLLEEDDFNEKWRDTILSITSSVATIVHLPWLPRLMKILPTKMAQVITPDVSILLDYEKRIRAQVSKVLQRSGLYNEDNRQGKTLTIFEELRDSTGLQDSEKSLQRLSDEGNVLLIAGSETPAKVMALITYHLLANPPALRKLQGEIASVQRREDGSLPLALLEALPYFSSVVREGLRLHNGIVARSQRISPHSPVRYKNWIIPAGTPMSCTSIYIHYNSKVFPDPWDFRPERWMVDDKSKKQLEKHYAPFGRGTRSCLGYSLGLAELYLGLAAVVTRFKMELFETGQKDVELERDWFIPQPSITTKGVRVTVRGYTGDDYDRSRQ